MWSDAAAVERVATWWRLSAAVAAAHPADRARGFRQLDEVASGWRGLAAAARSATRTSRLVRTG
jgi:hypothetical protein